MARKVTLSDVAREAGVSIATVDRVVNGRGGVEVVKEEKVVQAARLLGLDRRLDYKSLQIRRVAVMLQPPANPFHAELQAGIEQARKIFASLNIQMQILHIAADAHSVVARRVRELPDWADGLIVSASDTPEIAAAVRSVSSTIPVITLANDIANCGRLAYVGPDDERSGRVAADLLGVFMGARGGHVLVLAGRLDLAGQRARIRGFGEVLTRRHPACQVINILEAGEGCDSTADLVYRSLQVDPKIHGVYQLSVGATGVVQALEALDRQHDVYVVGHELTPNRRNLLRQRKIHAVLDQNPRLEARLAAESIAARLGRLDRDAGPLETSVQIFMAENI